MDKADPYCDSSTAVSPTPFSREVEMPYSCGRSSKATSGYNGPLWGWVKGLEYVQHCGSGASVKGPLPLPLPLRLRGRCGSGASISTVAPIATPNANRGESKQEKGRRRRRKKKEKEKEKRKKKMRSTRAGNDHLGRGDLARKMEKEMKRKKEEKKEKREKKRRRRRKNSG